MSDIQTKKCDRRVVKTKRAIRTAFLKLLEKQEINSITIKDVADLADVDRKTIYNYYAGVHEIMDEIEDELVTSFDVVMEDMDYDKIIKNQDHIFDTLNRVIDSNLELYSQLMKINNNSNIVAKITASLTADIRSVMDDSPLKDSIQKDMISRYIAAGMVSVYTNWFNSTERVPLSELSKAVSSLLYYGVNAFIEQ